jgi:hypothetical protein
MQMGGRIPEPYESLNFQWMPPFRASQPLQIAKGTLRVAQSNGGFSDASSEMAMSRQSGRLASSLRRNAG